MSPTQEAGSDSGRMAATTKDARDPIQEVAKYGVSRSVIDSRGRVRQLRDGSNHQGCKSEGLMKEGSCDVVLTFFLSLCELSCVPRAFDDFSCPGVGCLTIA